ncbi:hypothetical protein EDC96DRAFT_564572 [Choanephora cucurbitarum]|nr:hypothetical protein EDC96DRAFT_564572 [Choanephora cucurbitarum]
MSLFGHYNQLNECVTGIQQKIRAMVKNVRARIQVLQANSNEKLIYAPRNAIKVYIGGLRAKRSRMFPTINQKAPMQSKVLQQITKQPTIARVDGLQMTDDPATITDDFAFSSVDSGIIEMTESIPVSIHNKLYNRFYALTDVKEEEETAYYQASPNCLSVQSRYNTSSRDTLSAFAIVISEITALPFQQVLPSSLKTVSHPNAEFNDTMASSSKRKDVKTTREAMKIGQWLIMICSKSRFKFRIFCGRFFAGHMA